MYNKATNKQTGLSIPLRGINKERSVKLSQTELKHLSDLRKSFTSDSSFARAIGIDRVSIMRIIRNKYGSGQNVQKIRRKISKIKTAA
jgi:hypothetical protein